MTDEKLYTVKELADHYRVSEETIRRWARNGDIPYKAVGPFKLKRFEKDAPIQEVKNERKGNASKVSERGTEETARGDQKSVRLSQSHT